MSFPYYLPLGSQCFPGQTPMNYFHQDPFVYQQPVQAYSPKVSCQQEYNQNGYLGQYPMAFYVPMQFIPYGYYQPQQQSDFTIKHESSHNGSDSADKNEEQKSSTQQQYGDIKKNDKLQAKLAKKRKRPCLSESKNLAKIYSMAVIKYINHQQIAVGRLLDNDARQVERFFTRINSEKNSVNSIKDLKNLFNNDVEDVEIKKFNKVFRILMFKYFREENVTYIFKNKKIRHYDRLLKYRNVVLMALQNPESFNAWKLSDLADSPKKGTEDVNTNQ